MFRERPLEYSILSILCMPVPKTFKLLRCSIQQAYYCEMTLYKQIQISNLSAFTKIFSAIYHGFTRMYHDFTQICHGFAGIYHDVAGIYQDSTRNYVCWDLSRLYWDLPWNCFYSDLHFLRRFTMVLLGFTILLLRLTRFWLVFTLVLL